MGGNRKLVNLTGARRTAFNEERPSQKKPGLLRPWLFENVCHVDNLAAIKKPLNWLDWLLLRRAILGLTARLDPTERVLAAAKGGFFVRTMNSLPRKRGPGLLVVTCRRVLILGFFDKARTPFEIPKDEVIVLQDLCPDESPSLNHTVEVMTEIECSDGTSLSGRDTLTFSFVVSSGAAREIDNARTVWEDTPDSREA